MISCCRSNPGPAGTFGLADRALLVPDLIACRLPGRRFAGATDAQPGSDFSALLAEAAAVSRPAPVFDATDQRFTPPGEMPARIAVGCREHDLESLRKIVAETFEPVRYVPGVRP